MRTALSTLIGACGIPGAAACDALFSAFLAVLTVAALGATSSGGLFVNASSVAVDCGALDPALLAGAATAQAGPAALTPAVVAAVAVSVTLGVLAVVVCGALALGVMRRRKRHLAKAWPAAFDSSSAGAAPPPVPSTGFAAVPEDALPPHEEASMSGRSRASVDGRADTGDDRHLVASSRPSVHSAGHESARSRHQRRSSAGVGHAARYATGVRTDSDDGLRASLCDATAAATAAGLRVPPLDSARESTRDASGLSDGGSSVMHEFVLSPMVTLPAEVRAGPAAGRVVRRSVLLASAISSDTSGSSRHSFARPRSSHGGMPGDVSVDVVSVVAPPPPSSAVMPLPSTEDAPSPVRPDSSPPVALPLLDAKASGGDPAATATGRGRAAADAAWADEWPYVSQDLLHPLHSREDGGRLMPASPGAAEALDPVAGDDEEEAREVFGDLAGRSAGSDAEVIAASLLLHAAPLPPLPVVLLPELPEDDVAGNAAAPALSAAAAAATANASVASVQAVPAGRGPESGSSFWAEPTAMAAAALPEALALAAPLVLQAAVSVPLPEFPEDEQVLLEPPSVPPATTEPPPPLPTLPPVSYRQPVEPVPLPPHGDAAMVGAGAGQTRRPAGAAVAEAMLLLGLPPPTPVRLAASHQNLSDASLPALLGHLPPPRLGSPATPQRRAPLPPAPPHSAGGQDRGDHSSGGAAQWSSEAASSSPQHLPGQQLPPAPVAVTTVGRPETSDPVAGVAALPASPVAASRPPPLPLQQHGTVRTTLAAAATLARLGLLSPGLDPSANRGSSPLVHHQLPQQAELRQPPLASLASGTVRVPSTGAIAAGRRPSALFRSRSSAALGEGTGASLAGAVGGWVSSRAAAASDDVAVEAAIPVARGDAATHRSPAQQLPWQRQQELLRLRGQLQWQQLQQPGPAGRPVATLKRTESLALPLPRGERLAAALDGMLLREAAAALPGQLLPPVGTGGSPSLAPATYARAGTSSRRRPLHPSVDPALADLAAAAVAAGIVRVGSRNVATAAVDVSGRRGMQRVAAPRGADEVPLSSAVCADEVSPSAEASEGGGAVLIGGARALAIAQRLGLVIAPLQQARGP